MDRPADKPTRPEIMDHFTYEHLPPHLQEISKMFTDLAEAVLVKTRPGAEQSVALRKLLEGKDAAVRAAIQLAKAAPEFQRGTPFSP